ncbi:TPA: alanine/glycine:cation symporter family protein [Citrobacter farmeri]|uniref:alanine/glycine:cation symporter family protein n=1 Tax=Citrobacter farmeri TaxID=67824 RepID=UPI000F67F60D|nr:sodium:alanine symporter family protein [Citrobacter farmeri]RSB15419.1 sodium:alanine symporter family protein [Citrobacter farmeri]HEM6629860.1 sodium:alanine symporter family protein [Citrobacter farmeri]HEM6632192.1 sodium:alanine symporter family protein [Citrobacter farmeri]HEM6741965.1 sodium:alanine symporter family protein [Citrobacter farmeri]
MEFIQSINAIFWGWLVAGLLLGTGIFFAFRLSFPQIRYFPQLFNALTSNKKAADKKGVSGFGALCAALSSQVGTGSLVGVATALASGGPGAIFWMWMTAILGMGISFSEAILAILFRESNGDGTYRGGPAYYMSRGLNCKPLAIAFSISMIIGMGFFYAMVQGNSIILATKGVIDVHPSIIGLVLVILVSVIIFGGVKRISDFASFFVPFLSVAYICLSLVIIGLNVEKLPTILTLIITSAFNFDSAAGGAAGYTVYTAFRYGVARGLFSNDAGNGTTPSMHATAIVNHPVTQGFTAMFGTFFTTIIVCSCTAFTILLTGALSSGYTGVELTQQAFTLGVGEWGKQVVFVAMLLFGFKSVIADIYYGEVNLRWIIDNKFATQFYRLLCCSLVVVCGMIPVATIWELVDFAAAMLILFNVPALLLLSKFVIFALRDYMRQKKSGVIDPIWDYTTDVKSLVINEKLNECNSPTLKDK